jgi:hypothetical protein
MTSADPRAHRARPWRVHTLAPDFELLDLWEVPLGADPARGETFPEFLRVFLTAGAATWPLYSLRPASIGDALHAVRLGGTVALLELRRGLGRLFALDADRTLAIPGRRENRVRTRLDADDRARDLGVLPATVGSAFEPVYAFADEALLEIANKTIHALLHLSWVEAAPGRRSVVLAVYVKSRGWQSRAYLALIKPFRHWVVYPAWIAHLRRTWTVLHPAGHVA